MAHISLLLTFDFEHPGPVLQALETFKFIQVPRP